MEKVMLFLDYAATCPNVIVTFHASKMILAVHSNASYFSKSVARSRAGGHFPLLNNFANPTNNGSVLAVSQIIKAVISSAAEA